MRETSCSHWQGKVDWSLRPQSPNWALGMSHGPSGRVLLSLLADPAPLPIIIIVMQPVATERQMEKRRYQRSLSELATTSPLCHIVILTSVSVIVIAIVALFTLMASSSSSIVI